MSSARLIRYFDLAGAVDADPLIAQPGPTALGDLVTGFGGAILVNAWECDLEARRVTPTVGLELTVGVVTLTHVKADQRPSGSGSVNETFWGRGPLSSQVGPGEWQIQAELGDLVGFTVIVTAKNLTPAGRHLAIYAARGPR